MSIEDDILIENYLKGLLTKEEQQSFLERLESDIEFEEKFKLEEQLFNTLNEDNWSFTKRNNSEVKNYKALLELNEFQNLKRTLIEVNRAYNSKSNKGKKRLVYYLAAATIVVFLGFQFFFNQRGSNEDLYNDYLNLSDLPSFVTRGSDDDITNKLVKAQTFFEARNYKESLEIFKPILDSIKTNSALYIYTGIAQTELGQSKNAEKTFNDLINSDLLESQAGYWYKALLYLKTNSIEDAKKLLDKIVSDSLYNHEKAERLLSEL